MKAPEKIYVKITHPISDEYTEMIAFEHGNGVEYTRTDAFIEKALEYLEPMLTEYAGFYVGGNILQHFKNYLKGE